MGAIDEANERKGKKGKKGKGAAGKGKDDLPPPPAPPPPPSLGSALALALGEETAAEKRERIKKRREEVGRGASAEPSSPLARLPSGGTAGTATTGLSAIRADDTPKRRERKLKYFARRGKEGRVEEVDIGALDEDGIKAVVDNEGFNTEEKKEILRGLKGKMRPQVKAEAERQLAILAGELGETASGTIGGEKQTSTPRPLLEDPLKVDNPIDDESTDEEEELELELPLPQVSAPEPEPSPDLAKLKDILGKYGSFQPDKAENLYTGGLGADAAGGGGGGSSIPEDEPPEPPEIQQAKKRIAAKAASKPETKPLTSNERQLKQLTDKYPSVELDRSPNTIMTQLLASVSNSDQPEAEFDRGMFDIANIFDLQNKSGKKRQKISQAKIDKFKKGKFE